jgi:hypothetical protein
MTAIPFILILVLLAAAITLVVPGGVFVAPVLLLIAIVWAVVRMVGSRRDSTAAGPR